MTKLYRILLYVVIVLGAGAQTLTAPGRPGFDIDLRGDVIVVTEVVEGSSAHSEELKVGDQLLRVDSMNVVGMKARRVKPMLRGPKGSDVRLTVLPRMQMVPRTVVVMRDIDDDAPGGDATTSEALRTFAASKTKDPDQQVRVQAVNFDEAKLSRDLVIDRIHSTVGDVQQCVHAVDGFPPTENGEFEVHYSMKGKGYVGVRIHPINVDVQVCVAAKAARWQLPQPKEAPSTIVVIYRLPAAGATDPDETPTPESTPE